MCFAVDKEHIVAGYINVNKDGKHFDVDSVMEYVHTLWNSGCGPVRLNFSRDELLEFLDSCNGIGMRGNYGKYVIDKSTLHSGMTEEEQDLFYGKEETAKSFDLFCRLQVNWRTPECVLDAMGFDFLCSE